MTKVDSRGQLEIKFNQEMIMFLQPVNYTKLFQFEVVSALDGAVSIGKSVNHSLDGSTKYLWQTYDTEKLQEQYFNFYWAVTEYTSESIKFKFYFEEPEEVSSTNF